MTFNGIIALFTEFGRFGANNYVKVVDNRPIMLERKYSRRKLQFRAAGTNSAALAEKPRYRVSQFWPKYKWQSFGSAYY